MRSSWSKGHTKDTHPSVRKISDTMKRRGLDNFKAWRDNQRRLGRIPEAYPELTKNGDLAELIGVVLGDGHIEKFPRTEALYILSNSNNRGFVHRYARLVEVIFNTQPTCSKIRGSNCIRIRIYQKHISKRLRIVSGDRGEAVYRTPLWIQNNRAFLIRYLRGLFEAEGSYNEHPGTYTYKFIFSNKNRSLLDNVRNGLFVLGFHPHESSDKIQLSRREEVRRAKALLRFRNY